MTTSNANRRLMLHLHPSANDPSALIDAVTQLDAPDATRLVFHAPGLARAGEHAAIIEYAVSHDPAEALAAAGAVFAQLGELVDPAQSAALIGTDHHLLTGEPTTIRFAYLMRRRPEMTNQQYRDHYLNNHAKFGLATPGIEGYTQFHVDLEASEKAATALGVGVHDIDSVSELHLESLDTFFAALVESGFGAEAGEDEVRFVDQANSTDYVYEIIAG